MRWQVILGAILFIGIRLLFLQTLPIFNDESMYLHWGWDFLGSGDWSESVVINGKPPGLTVALGIFQLLPLNPLVAGRLFSVISSLITYMVTLLIARRYFPKASLWPLMLLLTFCPFLLFFDRLALAESAITACSTVILFLFLSLWEKPTLIKGAGVGAILGLGWWIKSTILLTIFPITVIGFFMLIRRTEQRRPAFLACLAIAIVFFLLIAPLLFHPLYRYVQPHQGEWLLSVLDLLKFPFSLWINNIFSIGSWLVIYFTPAIFLFVLLGLGGRTKNTSIRILSLWTLLPLIVLSLISANLMSRYIVQFIPPLLLLAYQGITTISTKQRWVTWIAYGTTTIMSAVLIISPLSFFAYTKILPLTARDFAQYVTGWSSGYGVKEAADWIT